MRLLIIRHGDPDYANDSLTPKGEREAEYLSERLAKEGLTHLFVSPLGRAQKTAQPTVEKTGIRPVTLPWLQEFPARLPQEMPNGKKSPWDIPPRFWRDDPLFYDRVRWQEMSYMQKAGVQKVHEENCAAFDGLLSSLGYHKNGQLFDIEKPYEKEDGRTLAFFCHHGLGVSLLAHLTEIALPHMWHTFFLPTSSVTTVLMERHEPELPLAIARVIGLGDTSHLYAHGEPVSASGLSGDVIR